MSNRIGSAQIYTRNVDLMTGLQAQIDRAQTQISSGRRLINVSDDPVASARILQLDEAESRFSQYQKNIGVAENMLQQEESTLVSVTNVLQRVRELAVTAANGTQSRDSRLAIAKEVRARIDEVFQLANTRNASGESIFGGFQIRQDAYSTDGQGNYTYLGDQGQRFLQVGPERQIPVGDAGKNVFTDIPSGNGVYEISTPSTNQGAFEVTEDRLSSSIILVPDTYTVRFTSNSDGELAYVVEGAVEGTVIPSTADDPLVGNPPDDPLDFDDNAPAFVNGAPIAFNGIEIVIEGSPTIGDEVIVTPSPKQDIFTTLEAFASSLEQSAPGDGGALPEQVEAFQTALENITHAIDNISDVRTSVGARLSAVDSQKNNNDEALFITQSTKSDVQDLDYAEAISRLQLGVFSLQAAQQSFARIQGLSLFNYI